ncbi:MAG: TonB-dependent receptor [Bacteroidetes bacterium QS_8_68_15]|nr:MAG: TonB-dependent receptor [Bacteroidetes bacterium QS_8_68_15]
MKAASDFSSGLYIRGGSPDQTLVRLGETTVYNPTHFFGFFSTFNPDAIGDVQLYKGGFPSTYGGRLGAVVDLNNRRGSAEEASGRASAGLLASRVAADGPLPDAVTPAGAAGDSLSGGGSWMLAARRSTLEPLFAVLRRQDVDGIPNNFHFYDLNARVDVPLSSNDRLVAGGYAGADYLDFPFLDEARVQVPYGNRTATLRWRHLFAEGALGDRAFSDVSVSASRYFSRPEFGLAGNTFRRTNELTDLAANADLEVRTGAHTLRGGVRGSVFTSALERSLDETVLFSPTIRTGRLSAYAQDTWRPGDDVSSGSDGGSYDPWRITGGLRAAYHTRGRFLRLAPRLSVQYRPASLFGQRLDGRVRLQAGYGRYNQYLTVLSSSFFSGADTWFAAGEGVPPSYGDQLMGGLKLDLADAWRLDVEGYYRTMRDLFEINRYIQDLAGLPYEDAFWFGEGHAQGLEVKLERTDGPVTGFLAYTFAQTRRRFPNLNLEDGGGRRTDLAGLNAQNVLGGSYPPKYDRRHDLKAVFSYDFAEQWRATSVFTYATGQPFTRPQAQYELTDPPQRGTTLDVIASPFNGARLPPYHRLDVGVRRIGDLFGLDYELQVQLLNVYDRSNTWFYFYQTEDDGTVTREEVSQLPVPLPNVALTVDF